MQLNWAQVNQLAESLGDSFYLVDLEKFTSNYQDFLQAFRIHYPKSQIAYSYKTNYLPRFCEWVNAWGGYAEVVSGMEYRLALKIGVPATRIIFNGPYKPLNDLQEALLNGTVVNVDSAYELLAVKQLAQSHPDCLFRLGLRCNFDIGIGLRSRFGFESTELVELIESVRENRNCRIVALHCHFLAPQRSAQAYGDIARKMLHLATTELSLPHLEIIDLGGGFYSRMPEFLQLQFDHPIPDFKDYSSAIASQFVASFPEQNGPELVLEPGLALTADAVQFVTRIMNIKQLGKRSTALAAGSIYDVKPTKSLRQLPVTVVPQTGEGGKDFYGDIVGTTCMEDDCLYQGFKGQLGAGDFVVFDSVGAYTNVLRPPFIHPAPPIIALSIEGEVEVLRRREKDQDIFASYFFAPGTCQD